MATQTTGSLSSQQSQTIAKSTSMTHVTDWATAIVKPLASLKLTVFLLAVGVLVVWIATLDQTRIDIWELKNKHFRSLLVYVPFQTLFPPAWFPAWQDVTGGFYIPSGSALIFAMLINLTAAHSLRFRIQAQGMRLVLGLVAIAFTALLTWFIVFERQGADGLVAQPFSWTSLWTWLQVGLLALSIAAVSGVFLLAREQRVEKFLCGGFGITGLVVLGFTLYMGERAFVGDSAMRILWQLLQATVAASLGLVASLLLFRRKAGIVLLHLGIAGLLLNEIYVTVTNEEQQMEIVEGQTTSQAVDIRAHEMAIIDRSDPEFDQVTVIPASRLQTGEIISHDELPFDVQCLQYFLNSELVDLRPGESNRATAGIGTGITAIELPQITGTELEEKMNAPAAYVRLIDKASGQSLGVHLIGLLPYRSGFVDTVEVDGKSYQIGLRFKHVYKPYAVTLNDVERTDYLGTEIPRTYSSDIVLSDFERGLTTTQKIWMNNPLRYGGETFYQASYDASGPTEATTLQVVKNHGWMIPYVCCMFVVVGLVFQFGNSLLGFLKKRQSQRATAADNAESSAPRKSWVPAIVLLVIFGGYLTMQLSKSVRVTDAVVPVAADTTAAEQVDERDSSLADQTPLKIELLGKIPVTYRGRVQPLDSLARNLARQLSNRETLVYGDDKRSATHWLADTIFEAPGFADNYQFLRVEDLNVQQALDLPTRKRFKYTWNELRRSEEELIRLLREAAQLEPEQRTSMQMRLNEVYSKMSKVVDIKRALTDPIEYASTGSLIDQLTMAAQAATLKDVPLLVATQDADEPWISYAVARAREWLVELNAEYDASDVDQLAARIVDEKMIQPATKDLIREGLAKELLGNEEAVEKLQEFFGETSKAKIFEKLLDASEFARVPEEIYREQQVTVEQALRPKIERGRTILENEIAGYMRTINGQHSAIKPVDAIGLDLLKQIEPAYLAGDGEKFNRVIEDYLQTVHAENPAGLKTVGVKLESVYNKFSPFYLSMVLYLVAFVVGTLGWIGWTGSLNRAAFSLIVMSVMVHLIGIVARVVISGRPPVTNLYSSFVFVSAAAIVFVLVAEKITRLGVGNMMASLLGFLSLLWAWSMSISDGDTFTVLQAVLDTQFWLSTHVISISLGYCATIAAGFLGIAYIFGSLVTKRFDPVTRKLFANVIYGVVCFGLLFSFFGTVLGGLWADDSWGRFWGWDPKENGALMIVLWNAVVLHSRWAGLIRERGLAMLAIFGNVVTVWSWEAVNQMGVGLHAYGGSEGGRMAYVGLFWLINLAVIGVGLIPTRFWRSYRSD